MSPGEIIHPEGSAVSLLVSVLIQPIIKVGETSPVSPLPFLSFAFAETFVRPYFANKQKRINLLCAELSG